MHAEPHHVAARLGLDEATIAVGGADEIVALVRKAGEVEKGPARRERLHVPEELPGPLDVRLVLGLVVAERPVCNIERDPGDGDA